MWRSHWSCVRVVFLNPLFYAFALVFAEFFVAVLIELCEHGCVDFLALFTHGFTSCFSLVVAEFAIFIGIVLFKHLGFHFSTTFFHGFFVRFAFTAVAFSFFVVAFGVGCHRQSYGCSDRCQECFCYFHIGCLLGWFGSCRASH